MCGRGNLVAKVGGFDPTDIAVPPSLAEHKAATGLEDIKALAEQKLVELFSAKLWTGAKRGDRSDDLVRARHLESSRPDDPLQTGVRDIVADQSQAWVQFHAYLARSSA